MCQINTLELKNWKTNINSTNFYPIAFCDLFLLFSRRNFYREGSWRGLELWKTTHQLLDIYREEYTRYNFLSVHNLVTDLLSLSKRNNKNSSPWMYSKYAHHVLKIHSSCAQKAHSCIQNTLIMCSKSTLLYSKYTHHVLKKHNPVFKSTLLYSQEHSYTHFLLSPLLHICKKFIQNGYDEMYDYDLSRDRWRHIYIRHRKWRHVKKVRKLISQEVPRCKHKSAVGDQPTNRPSNRCKHRSAVHNQPTYLPTDRPTDQPTNLPTYQPYQTNVRRYHSLHYTLLPCGRTNKKCCPGSTPLVPFIQCLKVSPHEKAHNTDIVAFWVQ